MKYDKKGIKDYGRHFLYSTIAFKRPFNYLSTQWKEDIEYKRKSEQYPEGAINLLYSSL